MDKSRLTSLDFIKVIIATLIVFHHYQYLSGVKFNHINFYGGRIYYGYLVELFFMISGFLMQKSYEHKEGDSLKEIKKRLIRIYPMCIISMIFTIIVMGITGEIKYSFIQIITSLLLVSRGWFVEINQIVNAPTWFLCILILLDFVYILINQLVKDKKVKNEIWVVIILIGIVGFYNNKGIPFLYSSNCRGYVSFFIGVLIYQIYDNKSKRNITLISLIGFLLGVVQIAVSLGWLWYKLVILIYPSIIMIVANLKQISNKVIVLLGNATYEVYLWHFPLFYLLKAIVNEVNISVNAHWIYMLIYVFIVWAFSLLLYKSVEVPLIAHIKKL